MPRTLQHIDDNYNKTQYWPNRFLGGTPYPTAAPTASPSSSPSESICRASEFQGSTISFEAFNACWKMDLVENGALVGDFSADCLTSDFSNGQAYSVFDSFDDVNDRIYFNDPSKWSGYFTIYRSSAVTGIEVSQTIANPNTKEFDLKLLSPDCLAPGSCLAEGFLGETLYVAAFGACIEIQLKKDGILGMDASDAGCSRKDSAGQVILSKFSEVDGRNIYFNDPQSWSGTLLVKESSDVTGPEIQNPNIDDSAKEFLVDLVVPSCRN